MKNAFNEIVTEICRYYGDRGFSREMLAEKIGISKRTLQKWEVQTPRPKECCIKILYEFLEEHNGGHYLQMLKQILGGGSIEQKTTSRGIFPDTLDQKDIDIIRDNFPGCNELKFLCAMIVFNDQFTAATTILPEGTIAQKASLIASYNVSMNTARDVFGFNDVYEWQEKIIRYMGENNVPKTKYDIEVLGQKALDNIIEGYTNRRNSL